MKYIAKTINFDNSFYKGQHLCLCVFSEESELLESISSSYPLTLSKDQWVIIDNQRYRIVAFISDDANAREGEIFNEEDLFWCDPKTLLSYSKKEFFPIKELLFTERGGWIDIQIYVKRLVYKIV